MNPMFDRGSRGTTVAQRPHIGRPSAFRLVEVTVSRIVIFEPRPGCDDCRAMLEDSGNEVVVCDGAESLFASLLMHRPDVLVYVLGDLQRDLSVLGLVRRAVAGLPLILLGGPSELAARRSVQELMPVYYGVFPLDPAELSEAVRGALREQARIRAGQRRPEGPVANT
jgi:DNA-binding response OmpR family regulator